MEEFDTKERALPSVKDEVSNILASFLLTLAVPATYIFTIYILFTSSINSFIVILVLFFNFLLAYLIGKYSRRKSTGDIAFVKEIVICVIACLLINSGIVVWS